MNNVEQLHPKKKLTLKQVTVLNQYLSLAALMNLSDDTFEAEALDAGFPDELIQANKGLMSQVNSDMTSREVEELMSHWGGAAEMHSTFIDEALRTLGGLFDNDKPIQ